MLMFQLLLLLLNNVSEAMDAYTFTLDQENMPEKQFTQDTSTKNSEK